MHKGNAYWENETPQETRTGKVWLAYFPQAGKLQVSQVWMDRETGEPRRGKTVTLDAEDMALHDEARELLARFLEGAKV